MKHEPVVTVWRNRIPYPTYLVYGGWRFTWCRDHWWPIRVRHRWSAFASIDDGDYVNIRTDAGHHTIWHFNADGTKMILGQRFSVTDLGEL